MDLNLNYLFFYLNKENIKINKSEFEFQIQSHPDYPSLLSITDILTFFNIDNGSFRLDFTHIDSLQHRFIALTKKEGNKKAFCFIEKKSR